MPTITFTYSGYTKKGRKFVAGTHEVSEADYEHFKPYSTVSMVSESDALMEPVKPIAEAVEEVSEGYIDVASGDTVVEVKRGRKHRD